MSENFEKILAIDENRSALDEMVRHLSTDFQIRTTVSAQDARNIFKVFKPNVVIMDVGLADGSFFDLLSEFKEGDQDVVRIATSDDYNNLKSIMEAINLANVHKFYKKPIDYSDLKSIIRTNAQGLQAAQDGKIQVSDEASYAKLKSSLNLIEEAEMLRKQVDSQKSTSYKLQQAQIQRSKQIEELEDVVENLCLETEALERLNEQSLAQTERERNALRVEVDRLSDENEDLKRKQQKLEVKAHAEQVATFEIDDTFDQYKREKRNGLDSVLYVGKDWEAGRKFSDVFETEFNVLAVDNEEKAIGLLEKDDQIRLMITEQQMGVSLAQLVNEMYPDFPVFLLTNGVQIEVSEGAVNSVDITKYVGVPFDPRVLRREIKAAIKKYDTLAIKRMIIDKRKKFIVTQFKEQAEVVEELQRTVDHYPDKVSDLRKSIKYLKSDQDDREELHKERLGIVESKRDSLKEELKKLTSDYKRLLAEKELSDKTAHDYKVAVDSQKEATLRVTAGMARIGREKIDGKDSVLCVGSDDMQPIIDHMEKTYNVYTAPSADKALTALKDHKDICLILTNQKLAKVNGLELAARVKEISPAIPVCLLADSKDYEVAKDALNSSNIFKYFEKPYQRTLVSEVVMDGINYYDREAVRVAIYDEQQKFIVDSIQTKDVELQNLKFAVDKERQEMQKAMDAKRETLIKETTDKCDKMLAETRTEVDKNRSEIRGEHQTMVQSLDQRQKEQEAMIAKLDKRFAEQKATQEKLNRMQKEQELMADDLKRRSLSVEEQEDIVRDKLDKLRAETSKEMEEIAQERDRMREDARKEKDQLRRDTQQSIQELTVKRDKLDKEVKRDQEEIIERTQRQRRESDRERDDMVHELEKLRKDVQRERDGLLEEQEQMRRMVAKEKEAALAKIEDEHRALIAEQKREMDELSERVNKKRELVSAESKEEIDSIKKKHRIAHDTLMAELEEEGKLERDILVKRLEKERELLLAKSTEERNEITRKMEKERNNLMAELKEERDLAKIEKEEILKKLDKEREVLMNEIKDAREEQVLLEREQLEVENRNKAALAKLTKEHELMLAKSQAEQDNLGKKNQEMIQEAIAERDAIMQKSQEDKKALEETLANERKEFEAKMEQERKDFLKETERLHAEAEEKKKKAKEATEAATKKLEEEREAILAQAFDEQEKLKKEKEELVKKMDKEREELLAESEKERERLRHEKEETIRKMDEEHQLLLEDAEAEREAAIRERQEISAKINEERDRLREEVQEMEASVATAKEAISQKISTERETMLSQAEAERQRTVDQISEKREMLLAGAKEKERLITDKINKMQDVFQNQRELMISEVEEQRQTKIQELEQVQREFKQEMIRRKSELERTFEERVQKAVQSERSRMLLDVQKERRSKIGEMERIQHQFKNEMVKRKKELETSEMMLKRQKKSIPTGHQEELDRLKKKCELLEDSRSALVAELAELQGD
ncbi:MAG: response regulator [Bacteriovoracaceae bacterium]|nr:response regulator [Bacteriovoracaceae bacterium]